MISSKKAVESAQVIADFCNEQKGCQNCIFRKYGSDSWKCYISSYYLQDVLSNIMINQIDAAIEVFEEDMRDGACSPDCPDCNARITALACLRECAERREGCEYCLQGEDLAYGHDSMQRTGRIYIDGNLLTADLYSESMAVAVCCCPMCGRKLERSDR